MRGTRPNRRTARCPSDYQSGDENHPNSPFFIDPPEEPEPDLEEIAEDLTREQEKFLRWLSAPKGRRMFVALDIVEPLTYEPNALVAEADDTRSLTDLGELVVEWLEGYR